MRVLGLAVVIGLLSSTAMAQTGLRSASLPDRTPQNPIPTPRVDQFVAGPRTYTPRLDNLQNLPIPRHPQRGHRGYQRNYGLPIASGYGYGYYSRDVYPREEIPESIPNGYLYLQLQPGAAQVSVDGLYMGTVDDFRRLIPGRSLEAGPHRVELSAPGYERASFDVMIAPNETIAYRTDLQPLQPRERPAVIARATPKTFYVIPGCYAGDKPPRRELLPPGCEAAKVRVIP